MITGDDVRTLLGQEDAVLVLLHGRAEVIPAAELDSERYHGAMLVASGRDLRESPATDRSASGSLDLDALAATLDAMVAEQGG